MNVKICIIASNFYPNITKNLVKGAKLELKKNRINTLDTFFVDGSFEIPVAVSKLIGKYDGFVLLGAIIKGQTPHFDYLCSSIFRSVIDLSTKNKVPIGNGILTCNNKNQAIKRSDFRKIDKGGKAASAVISVLKIK
jgi:6,7-dimethyl-8-ribityllumazine synthase